MAFGDTEEKTVLSEETEASSWRQQESPGATDDRTVSCCSSSSCNTTNSKSSLGEKVCALSMILTKEKRVKIIQSRAVQTQIECSAC